VRLIIRALLNTPKSSQRVSKQADITLKDLPDFNIDQLELPSMEIDLSNPENVPQEWSLNLAPDIEIPRNEADLSESTMDVEVGRRAESALQSPLLPNFEDDRAVSKEPSAMEMDIPEFSFEIPEDIPMPLEEETPRANRTAEFMPEPLPEEPLFQVSTPVARKKRARTQAKTNSQSKKTLVVVDRDTELSTQTIMQHLKDTSDIVISEDFLSTKSIIHRINTFDLLFGGTDSDYMPAALSHFLDIRPKLLEFSDKKRKSLEEAEEMTPKQIRVEETENFLPPVMDEGFIPDELPIDETLLANSTEIYDPLDKLPEDISAIMPQPLMDTSIAEVSIMVI
jgi:hypothetical protein